MLHRKQSQRRGASAVEMALVAPVFVALVMGIIESSRLGMVSQLITTAAREGCRVAVLNGMTQANVQNRVDAVLSRVGDLRRNRDPNLPQPLCMGLLTGRHSDHGEPERAIRPGELAARAVLPQERHRLMLSHDVKRTPVAILSWWEIAGSGRSFVRD